MNTEYNKPGKNSFHRKLNRVNRFIFLFGGIFVAISLAIMYHYMNLAQSEKTKINLVILSNNIENNDFSPKIVLNDSLILFDKPLFTKQSSVTIHKKIGKNNVISCLLRDSVIAKSEMFDNPTDEKAIQITCSLKNENDIISAEIFYSLIE